MAICFEMVVNFGDNLEAARKAALANPSPMALRAGRHRIPLHHALLTTAGSYIELSVIPVAVGFGVGRTGRFRGPGFLPQN